MLDAWSLPSSWIVVIATISFVMLRKLLPIFLVFFKPDSLRDLPGPTNSSWFFGNAKEVRASERSAVLSIWAKTYGKTYRYKVLFNSDVLYTLDTRAISHVLNHSNDYLKPQLQHFVFSQAVGEGLLTAEGDQHRRQRRIMNPAFGPAQIRELTEIFVTKAHQLRDIWKEEVSKCEESARINILNGLNKMTLDVIGLAGFNYMFNALNPHGKPNELNEALNTMFRSLTQLDTNVLRFLQFYLPPLQFIPNSVTRSMNKAKGVMRCIGMRLIAEKKAEVLGISNTGEKDKHLQSRDLLTLLIKANMSSEIPESQRLSDEGVLAQVPTFLLAGHETTSNATTWCLFALAHAQKIQQKLREELLSVPTESPSMDELNELPYLDAVIRETLRIHPPLDRTVRRSTKDDVIPLNTPYTDVHGQAQNSVRINKGCAILIPILAINKSKELWGEDADEFYPERWLAGVPEAVRDIPGVWGNMLSFLGGPRSCIGYRFSLVEMKALLFSLIRAFEFHPAVPYEDITRERGVVQRPVVRSEMEKGSQLPLLVRLYQR
ncbi:uncharacterized protein FIBRA_06312 [Fibroporia radiculosa]|uniref:Cytochrome P450 n=1 Tax=Fibroporia radiculosa TaxID=599839 RepID=J4GSI6_9APHY|nr:uncharacterized protein FIBRA_06312 [Fibroporia radiculosa]CCM04150.1 predicted protein [Fibroporia radiculosa]